MITTDPNEQADATEQVAEETTGTATETTAEEVKEEAGQDS